MPEHRFCPASRGPGHLLQEGPSGAAPGAPAACSPRCLFAHLVPLWDVGQGPGTDSEGAVVETQSCGAEDLLPPPGDAGEEPGASGALLCARARRDTGGLGWLQQPRVGLCITPTPQSKFGAPNSTPGSGCPRQRGRGMLRARARGRRQPRLSGGSGSVLAAGTGTASADASRSIRHLSPLSPCSWGLVGSGCQHGPNALCRRCRGCSAQCWSSHGAPGILPVLGVPVSPPWDGSLGPRVLLGSPTLLAHV